MAKVGVCLSGCGFKDGAEIHESVITILALDRAGAEIIFFAPNVKQTMVVNHLTGETTGQSRNVLEESARIARGNISDITNINVRELDALIFPGGFGAALNLCDFGLNGANSGIHTEIQRIIRETITAQKPIGVICIAPAMMSRALKDMNMGARLTIGTDERTASEMEKLGAEHVNCTVDDIVFTIIQFLAFKQIR